MNQNLKGYNFEKPESIKWEKTEYDPGSSLVHFSVLGKYFLSAKVL